MLSVGTTASAGLKDWVHSFYSNLNVLESGLANQNYVFFPILGGARAGGAPPPGSAPDIYLLSMPTRSHFTSHVANQNYDSTHIKTQCFTIAIVSFFELSELKVTMIDWCLTQYFSYIMACKVTTCGHGQ
jgi:hypothetical protein